MRSSLRNLLLGFLFISVCSAAIAQSQPSTDEFKIEGDVKSSVTINPKALKPTITLDSVVIYNHLRERKSLVKNVKGILLRDVFKQVEFNASSPKLLSEYYLIFVASDNYKIVFSWNELFNTETGDHALLILERDGVPYAEDKERISILSPTDKATGRRYLKGLSKVIIKRVI